MTRPKYDREFWEDLWAKTIREHGDKIASKPPSAYLPSELEGLTPGEALDAGCGHGAESMWLAAHGWRVTAVDFSEAALAHARSLAAAAGNDISSRIDFVQGDLTQWTRDAGRYDLVLSLYVHIPGSVEATVRRLAAGVAPGGTLLLVGHQPIDPATGEETRAAGQVQVSLEPARAALNLDEWTLVVAEERPRTRGGGVDAVIRAQRAR